MRGRHDLSRHPRHVTLGSDQTCHIKARSSCHGVCDCSTSDMPVVWRTVTEPESESFFASRYLSQTASGRVSNNGSLMVSVGSADKNLFWRQEYKPLTVHRPHAMPSTPASNSHGARAARCIVLELVLEAEIDIYTMHLKCSVRICRHGARHPAR
jgi:hypothetical protein